MGAVFFEDPLAPNYEPVAYLNTTARIFHVLCKGAYTFTR
jgi:hypothetical protein